MIDHTLKLKRIYKQSKRYSRPKNKIITDHYQKQSMLNLLQNNKRPHQIVD